MDVIQAAMVEQGYPPTMRQIGAAAGLASVSSVRHQLVTLEAKGWLGRHPDRPRSYVPVTSLADDDELAETVGAPGPKPVDGAGYVLVPMVRLDKDGQAESGGEQIAVASLLSGAGDLVAFTMPDASMTGVAIRAGDTVVEGADKYCELG